MANEPMIMRCMAPIAASMVRCIRDNGRFISVASFLKDLSPSLFLLLTRHCGKQNAKNEFSDFRFDKKGEGSIKGHVATNIPALVGILLSMYVQDRPFITVKDKEASLEKFGEVENGHEALEEDGDDEDVEVDNQADLDPSDARIRMKKFKAVLNFEKNSIRDNHVDFGNWFHVTSDLRTFMLTMPMVKKNTPDGSLPPVGTAFKTDSTKKEWKFGSSIAKDWGENEPMFFFPEMYKEEACTLDKFLHIICTGGFKDPEEEREWYSSHPPSDIEKLDEDDLEENHGTVGRQILGARVFWEKAESDCRVLTKMPKSKSETDFKVVMDRIWNIVGGTYNSWDNLHGDEDIEETDEKDESIPVRGLFNAKEMALVKKKGRPALLALAQQCELVKNRALMHLAAHDLDDDSASAVRYKLENHFNNRHCVPKQGSWNAEGPLLKPLTQRDVKDRLDQFKKHLRTTAKELEAEQQQNHEPDAHEGKHFVLVQFRKSKSNIPNS